MKITFEKCTYFQNSDQITMVFCWFWWYWYLFWGRDEREGGRKGGKWGGRERGREPIPVNDSTSQYGDFWNC